LIPLEDHEGRQDLSTSDVLPPQLIRELSNHYYAGVKKAEVLYEFHAADEDAVTGALGQSLAEPQPLFFQIGETAYWWNTTYYKVRGRGEGAPEKAIGADGIFQLEVFDENNNVLIRKGLLFQSKIDDLEN
jgi:hypothetical protein